MYLEVSTKTWTRVTFPLRTTPFTPRPMSARQRASPLTLNHISWHIVSDYLWLFARSLALWFYLWLYFWHRHQQKKATHGSTGTAQHTRFALGDQVDVIHIPFEDDAPPAPGSVGEKDLPNEVKKTDSEESFHSWAGMRPLSIKDTVSRLRELQRDKKPLSFCKLIVTYPKTALGEHTCHIVWGGNLYFSPTIL